MMFVPWNDILLKLLLRLEFMQFEHYPHVPQESLFGIWIMNLWQCLIVQLHYVILVNGENMYLAFMLEMIKELFKLTHYQYQRDT